TTSRRCEALRSLRGPRPGAGEAENDTRVGIADLAFQRSMDRASRDVARRFVLAGSATGLAFRLVLAGIRSFRPACVLPLCHSPGGWGHVSPGPWGQVTGIGGP